MSSFTFNKNANPITPYFMTMLEDYMYQAEDITGQIEDAADLITSRSKELEPAEYQEELEDAHHFLIQSMDDYLNDLNYFRHLGQFERLKVLHQQKAQIDIKHPSIKILDDDLGIEREVQAVIKDVFTALELIRAAMSEDTKQGILNISSAADEFAEATNIGRFIEPDDMNDRMEYMFWLNFSRRLNFYELSDQMADYLDALESDPEERCEVIKARLRGREQEMFPPQMCTLDGFSDDEVEMARHIIAEEDAQNAENEHDGDSADHAEEANEITDIFEFALRGAPPEPSNNNATNKGDGATIIPLAFFRKKKEKDRQDPPKP